MAEEDDGNECRRVNLDDQFQSVRNSTSSDIVTAPTISQHDPTTQDIPRPSSADSNATQPPTIHNTTQAPPNRQYNKANGSAGADNQ